MKQLLFALAFVAGTAHADFTETLQLCTSCHGDNGTSVTPEFPNLARQYTEYLVHELLLYKKHLRASEAMSAIMDTVPDDQLLPLAKYFAWQVPVAATPVSAPDLIAKGRALYFSEENKLGLSCADCHGSEGEGTPPLGYVRAFPRVAGQQFDFLVAALQQYGNGKKETLLGMRAAMRGLTDSDFAALAAFMNATRPRLEQSE